MLIALLRFTACITFAATPIWIAAADLASLKPLAMPTNAAAVPGSLLYRDDFSDNAALERRWVIEQQPGGSATIAEGRLVIRDAGGTTVWFRHPLQAPVIITYRATVHAEPRVSDLNCFWMAADPDHVDDLFADGHGRTGAFATYDQLKLYYVGYGGNTNTSTRFRRYSGDGTKPLLPEHDLSAPELLLVGGHTYEIVLIAAFGHAQFIRDGQVVFDFKDPAPLTTGWFGFRTVQSRIEITDFRVWEGKAPSPLPSATAH